MKNKNTGKRGEEKITENFENINKNWWSRVSNTEVLKEKISVILIMYAYKNYIIWITPDCTNKMLCGKRG